MLRQLSFVVHSLPSKCRYTTTMSKAASFERKTTAEEVALEFKDYIKGRGIFLTGASIGSINFEVARVIAKYSPSVLILAGRSDEKLDAAEAKLKTYVADLNVRKVKVDLSSLKSIPAAAEMVLAYPEGLVVIINSAALVRILMTSLSAYAIDGLPLRVTEDGVEAQLAAAHTGHFLLTHLLLPKLLKSDAPRVVNCSSSGHYGSDIRWEDPNYLEKTAITAGRLSNGQCKTANLLYTKALVELYGHKGLTAFSLDPGGVDTPLQRFWTKEDIERMTRDYNAFNADGSKNMDKWKTMEQGASTHVVAAFSPEIIKHNGGYLVDCQISDIAAHAKSLESPMRLLKLSEKLVGREFPTSE